MGESVPYGAQKPKRETTPEKWPSPVMDPGGYARACAQLSIEKTLEATAPYWEALIKEQKETNRLLLVIFQQLGGKVS